MQKERYLHTLHPGEEGVITKIETLNSELKLRLLTLGLVPDTRVYLKNRAPLGDPLSIEVRGFCLSLRKSEAEAVLLSCL